MGTSIELCLGNVSLSYSKNHMGIDYGFLFQNSDLTRRKSESINYEDYEENLEEQKELGEIEEGFARTLSRVLPRLNLLGFTLETADTEYQALLKEAEEISNETDVGESKKKYLTFEEFCNLACLYPLADLENDYIEYDTPDRDKISQGRFSTYINLFDRIPWSENSDSY